jgi:hypothetical protein
LVNPHLQRSRKVGENRGEVVGHTVAPTCSPAKRNLILPDGFSLGSDLEHPLVVRLVHRRAQDGSGAAVIGSCPDLHIRRAGTVETKAPLSEIESSVRAVILRLQSRMANGKPDGRRD